MCENIAKLPSKYTNYRPLAFLPLSHGAARGYELKFIWVVSRAPVGSVVIPTLTKPVLLISLEGKVKKKNRIHPSLWLRFCSEQACRTCSVGLFCFFFFFFIWFIFRKGESKVEQDQKHGETAHGDEECWHGKESSHPSMKVKKVRERGRGKMISHTHIQQAEPPPTTTDPHSSAALHRRNSVSPAQTRHIKESITARLHGDTLQRYRCSAVAGR